MKSVGVSWDDEVSKEHILAVGQFPEGSGHWLEGVYLFCKVQQVHIDPPPHPSLPSWLLLHQGICYWPLLLELSLLGPLKSMYPPLSILLDCLFSEVGEGPTPWWTEGTELGGHKSSFQLWVFLDVLSTFWKLGPVLGTCGEEEVGQRYTKRNHTGLLWMFPFIPHILVKHLFYARHSSRVWGTLLNDVPLTLIVWGWRSVGPEDIKRSV